MKENSLPIPLFDFLGRKCVCLKTLGYVASLMKSIVLFRDPEWVRALPTYLSCEHFLLHKPGVIVATWYVKDLHASS